MPSGWDGFWQRRELGFDSDFPQVAPPIDLPFQYHNPSPVVSPRMNYGKKDEDADTGLVKIDRTQVYQEGEQTRIRRSAGGTDMQFGKLENWRANHRYA